MRRTAALAAALLLPAAALAQDLPAAFAAADVNGDGVLNVDEYVAATLHRVAELDAAGNADGMLSPDEIPGVNLVDFTDADRDGDGLISPAEAAADRLILFFDADANGDGVVNLAELEALSKERSE